MVIITPFPRKTVQDSSISSMIKKFLGEMTCDEVMIDRIGSRMKTFVDAYADIWFEPSFNLVVPITISPEETTALLHSIEKSVDQAAEQVNEIISRIVIERLLFEVQLYESGQYPYFSKPSLIGKKN